jgi:hypothetical protein
MGCTCRQSSLTGLQQNEWTVNNQSIWQSNYLLTILQTNKQTYHPTPFHKPSRHLLVLRNQITITIITITRTYPGPVQPNLEISLTRCVSNATLKKHWHPEISRWI